MEHTRVWNQSERCWKFGTFEMSNKDILRRYCECMEKGKFVTSESLSLRMETLKRNDKLKWEWLNADIKAFAFRPTGNKHAYQR